MKPLVSNHTLKHFHNILKDRSKVRNSIQREEEHYYSYVENIKAKEEKKANQEMQHNSIQYSKIGQYFKEDVALGIGPLSEEIISDTDLNMDRRESIDSSNLEKKENKLKTLLELDLEKEKQKEKEKEKFVSKNKNNLPKFNFAAEDFPELDENTHTIKNEEEVFDADSHEEKLIEYHMEQEFDLMSKKTRGKFEQMDDGFSVVKGKQSGSGGNKNKKKKKFEEIKLDIFQEPIAIQTNSGEKKKNEPSSKTNFNQTQNQTSSITKDKKVNKKVDSTNTLGKKKGK